MVQIDECAVGCPMSPDKTTVSDGGPDREAWHGLARLEAPALKPLFHLGMRKACCQFTPGTPLNGPGSIDYVDKNTPNAGQLLSLCVPFRTAACLAVNIGALPLTSRIPLAGFRASHAAPRCNTVTRTLSPTFSSVSSQCRSSKPATGWPTTTMISPCSDPARLAQGVCVHIAGKNRPFRPALLAQRHWVSSFRRIVPIRQNWLICKSLN
jgi:hypothetical protein